MERNPGETKPDTPVDPVVDYTEVYATLYTDGILGFSSTENTIAGKTPVEGKTWNITGERYSLSIGEEDYTATTPWFGDREKITSVVIADEIVPESVTEWFAGCTKLKQIDNIENLNTSNASNFSALFFDCVQLPSIDLSSLNTSNVTNMYGMFGGYSNYMQISNITIPDDFDTSKVTDMSRMFYRCNAQTDINLNGFDTSNVTYMNSMFYNCASLDSLDVSNFDTSNVTDMSWMFGEYYKLSILDLRSFDTSKVTDMEKMFYGDSTLTQILATEGKWVVNSTTNTTNMFTNCNISNVTKV